MDSGGERSLKATDLPAEGGLENPHLDFTMVIMEKQSGGFGPMPI
jgi:hypothetical protein